jgi:Ser/Thr protein kinase RdoA (MazF antagonist)
VDPLLKNAFYSLDPSTVLNAVEQSLNLSSRPERRCTGRLLALNSIENRVFAFDLEDGTEMVAKFYRPARWTQTQILEEHAFLKELRQAEVPVISPLSFEKSSINCETLSQTKEGIYFTVFPKVRGRLRDELFDEDIPVLGRLLARLHQVGSRFEVKTRPTLSVEKWVEDSLDFLCEHPLAQSPMAQRYIQLVEESLDTLYDRFDDVGPMHAIHGDCHGGNILWNENGPYFTDFDDFILGPPVQDLWMIFRSRGKEEEKRRELFIEAYEEHREFNKPSLSSIETLRSLRMIHYSAWIARRWEDPSFAQIFMNYGQDSWWREEYQALYETLEVL